MATKEMLGSGELRYERRARETVMKLAALAGPIGGCGIALVASVGCGDAGPGSSSSPTTAVPTDGVYKVQLETSSSAGLPVCNSSTAGETAIVTASSSLETCIYGFWVPIPCLVGGAVAYDSDTDTLFACTENPSGGPALWTQITLPQGPPGPAGSQGPPGVDGEAGAPGATGPQGATGAQGAQGPQGNDGPAGPQGLQGDTGPAGLPGPIGPQGPMGLQGLEGSPGQPGATGATGPAGATGATGPAGATGATGPQGDAGANALIVQTPFAAGAGTPAQNAACPNGGTEVDAGTDDGMGAFVGSVTTSYLCNGSPGAAGATGATGPQGPQGMPGVPGTLMCCGTTPAGNTAWMQYQPAGLELTVDISACGFAATPLVFTSLGGNAGLWETTGATSIYDASPTSFVIYINTTPLGATTVAQANSFDWVINWCATPE
jgi:hypothetical protein